MFGNESQNKLLHQSIEGMHDSGKQQTIPSIPGWYKAGWTILSDTISRWGGMEWDGMGQNDRQVQLAGQVLRPPGVAGQPKTS